MPRLKDKPVELDEDSFVDWLIEVYYFRFMDQGLAPAATPLVLSAARPSEVFIEQIRAQLTRFELTFPLTKLPALYQQALREISTHPARPISGQALAP